VPTYQYACTACGEKHEAVQSFTDAPLTECPACGGQLRKVFSAVGVVFKGSGFYKNDSRKSTGDGGGGKDSAKEPAAKTESKTETKADSGSTPAKSDTASKPASAPAAKSA
jgi:putative FmdB family regulatory protein